MAAGVGAVAFGLYVLTLAPTVTFVDSGELIVAAHELGVPHPPGFPLYTLLGHLAARVPVGTVAVRVHLLSALCAAAAAATLSLVVAEILLALPPAPARDRDRPRRRRARQTSVTESDGGTVGKVLPPVLAGLVFAVSRTLWSYATVAEVYTLNILLVLLALLLVLRWRGAVRTGAPRAGRLLWVAAFVYGLALGVHHVTVALMLPALVCLVIATAGTSLLRLRQLGPIVLAATLGLLVYAYLPLAAQRQPLLSWGDPQTAQRLWWHVTGRQYHSYFTASPALLFSEATGFVRRAAREFGPWWLPAVPLLGAAGALILWRRDRSLTLCLGLGVATNLAYALTYSIAEDKEAYLLPTFASMAVAAGVGAAEACRLRPRAVPAFGLLLVPVIGLAGNFPFADRSRYWLARDYVHNLLQTVEPNGMLLTLDWQVWSPMLYTRTIEAHRRDVVVIDVNLLRRSWYIDHLRREYPGLMAAVAVETEAYLGDLRQWEAHPELYERDPVANQRISDRFAALLLAFVRVQMKRGPAYVTQELALGRDPQNRDATRALTGAYGLMPQGLVFQLLSDRAYREPAALQWQLRGLADGSVHFEADDVVRIKVLPVYVTMLYNRGRYLALHGEHAEAITAYEQALALDPEFALARQGLAESRRALQ
jgi:hypothetical protein